MINLQGAEITAAQPTTPPAPSAFELLGLSREVLKSVADLGYERPTPIQAASIPLMMQGCDLIGSAQTGTGKTAAFALPILSQLKGREASPRALILTPTRELACQVDESIRKFAEHSGLRTVVIYGGVGHGRQLAALRRGVDLVIATPGRLLDHIERGTVKLGNVKFLVLDEADRMLDMGFLPDVKDIIGRTPSARQTALFSATIPPQLETLIKWAMRSPHVVEIGQRRSPAETVRHTLYPVAQSQKSQLLAQLMERSGYGSAIVFCRTKHGADSVSRALGRRHAVAVIHSNRSQREREEALGGFRSGKFKVLVATDIAARGIDVANITHVINYDVPQHPEDYVHRIGRTGRAESKGDAYTIMVAEESDSVAAIERFIGKKIDRQKLDDFEYAFTRLFEPQRANARTYAGKARGGRMHGGYSFSPGRRVR